MNESTAIILTTALLFAVLGFLGGTLFAKRFQSPFGTYVAVSPRGQRVMSSKSPNPSTTWSKLLKGKNLNRPSGAPEAKMADLRAAGYTVVRIDS